MRKPGLLTTAGLVVTLAALVFATWSGLQVRRMNTRLRSAKASADSAWSWMSALRDSLVRGGTVPPGPLYAPGLDSVWYTMLARSSSSLERFWYEQARKASAASNTMLSEEDILSLRRNGLHDPAEDLRRDLVAHPELIPYRSTEGGFQFFPEMAILLPNSWVCAYFEDGMVSGHLLLHYRVMPGGKILWKRLDDGRRPGS